MCVTTRCEFVKSGPIDKFMRFLFMRSSVLHVCIVMYGVIKIYVVQIYAADT